MATARELPHTSPEEVGISTEGLGKIDDLVQDYIDDGRIQGAVVGVTRRNKVVYMEAHGVLDDTTQRPMTKDAMFHMASSSDSLASWIPKVAAGPLDFQPGTRWA